MKKKGKNENGITVQIEEKLGFDRNARKVAPPRWQVAVGIRKGCHTNHLVRQPLTAKQCDL